MWNYKHCNYRWQCWKGLWIKLRGRPPPPLPTEACLWPVAAWHSVYSIGLSCPSRIWLQELRTKERHLHQFGRQSDRPGIVSVCPLLSAPDPHPLLQWDWNLFKIFDPVKHFSLHLSQVMNSALNHCMLSSCLPWDGLSGSGEALVHSTGHGFLLVTDVFTPCFVELYSRLCMFLFLSLKCFTQKI